MGEAGGVFGGGWVSSSHWVEYVGERGRGAAGSGDDGALSCGDSVSHAGEAGGCAAEADGGGDRAGWGGGSWGEPGAVPARSGSEWGGAVLGSGQGRVAER